MHINSRVFAVGRTGGSAPVHEASSVSSELGDAFGGRRAGFRKLVIAALAALAGCAAAPTPAAPCSINPAKVRSWSAYHLLEDATQEVRTLRFVGCGRTLTYVAADHTNDPESETYRQVKAAFAEAGPRAVVVEGFPSSVGLSPKDMLDYAAGLDGKPADAEPFLAIRLAAQHGAAFIGGEPTDADVLAYARANGLVTSDVFAFYVLRQVEEWRRSGGLKSHADPGLGPLISEWAPRFARDVGASAAELASVATAEGFKAWYRALNGVEFDTGYKPDDAYPSEPGARASRRLCDTIADARDRHIVKVIADMIDRHDKVLVVYGKSHLLIETPAFEAAFGPPRRVAPWSNPRPNGRG